MTGMRTLLRPRLLAWCASREIAPCLKCRVDRSAHHLAAVSREKKSAAKWTFPAANVTARRMLEWPAEGHVQSPNAKVHALSVRAVKNHVQVITRYLGRLAGMGGVRGDVNGDTARNVA